VNRLAFISWLFWRPQSWCCSIVSIFGAICLQIFFPSLPSAQAKPSGQELRPLPDFAYTQGWLGADDAYSVPIRPDTSIWLFGDTFVANHEIKLRSQYKVMVRNSVGISICKLGATCTIRYFWKKPGTPKARSFFDTGTDDVWYWPMDGFLQGKTLSVALMEVRNKPGASSNDVFGFEISGTKLAVIEHADLSPDQWHISITDLTGGHLWAGVSLVHDGKYVLWYTRMSEDESHAFMTVMRVPEGKMADPSGSWEYLKNDDHWASGLAKADAKHVIEQPISEMSVRYHPSSQKWIAVSIGPGFPSRRAVLRSADSPIGPWSNPETIYEFPEMNPKNTGYDKETFCYAVKEHTEFREDKIALTYACNSRSIPKVIANMDIYRPRVAVLDLPK
jgi:Domain of unknown function (DUF4185)